MLLTKAIRNSVTVVCFTGAVARFYMCFLLGRKGLQKRFLRWPTLLECDTLPHAQLVASILWTHWLMRMPASIDYRMK